MLSDITLGQFFPAKSWIHRADPRLKICLTVFAIVLIFAAGNFFSLAAAVAYVGLGMALSKIPLKMYGRALKPILFLVVFTAVLNVFYGTGEPLFQWGFLKVTQLTDALERLLRPLAKLRVPVHEFAMMMTIALRFVPLLMEETDKIMSAQKARGADMESGGLTQRVKALIPVLIPLFVSAFRRAYDLATAMESRCYQGGEGFGLWGCGVGGFGAGGVCGPKYFVSGGDCAVSLPPAA